MAFRRSGVRPSLAPPRFQTNLGIPAEDSRKQAGRCPAFLVFGKRAKSPTNRGVFEVAPSREHTSTHTSPVAESRSVRIRRAPEIGPDLLQSSLSPHFHRSVTYSPLSRAFSNGCERRPLQSDISLQRESILGLDGLFIKPDLGEREFRCQKQRSRPAFAERLLRAV